MILLILIVNTNRAIFSKSNDLYFEIVIVDLSFIKDLPICNENYVYSEKYH